MTQKIINLEKSVSYLGSNKIASLVTDCWKKLAERYDDPRDTGRDKLTAQAGRVGPPITRPVFSRGAAYS